MSEITIKDVAKKCGVGVSTVSRAINNHPDINPETRKMVMDCIEELGFIPNNSARNLKRTDAKCIAVLVKGITNPFFSNMVQIIEDETQKNRYALVLRHVEYYEDEVDVALELVKEKRLRGIIFLGGAFFHDTDKLAKLTVPFIFSTIGMGPSEDLSDSIQYSNIAVDDRAESRKMVDYLIGLGHKNIAIITENQDGPSVGKLRLDGYVEAMEAAGLGVKEELVRFVNNDVDHYSMKNGYVTTKKLLESGVKFTAIFAIADTLAIGACRALTEAGLKVPEDVSVAGYDGISLSEYYNPRLTTIKQPVDEMAKKTIKLLFDIIDEKKTHAQLVFPGELLIRESTAPVAGE